MEATLCIYISKPRGWDATYMEKKKYLYSIVSREINLKNWLSKYTNNRMYSIYSDLYFFLRLYILFSSFILPSFLLRLYLLYFILCFILVRASYTFVLNALYAALQFLPYFYDFIPYTWTLVSFPLLIFPFSSFSLLSFLSSSFFVTSVSSVAFPSFPF